MSSGPWVRGIAGAKSTLSYLGKVAVSRDAQKTDAVQSVKSMLLDRSATVNAKPELEIFADDVKCAHGATVGELDAQAPFYLTSRGLSEAEASTMIVSGFIEPLVKELPMEYAVEMNRLIELQMEGSVG